MRFEFQDNEVLDACSLQSPSAGQPSNSGPDDDDFDIADVSRGLQRNRRVAQFVTSREIRSQQFTFRR